VERGVALEFFLDDGDQDIGNEAANLRCIRELVRIPADGHFTWDVRWQGLKCVRESRRQNESRRNGI
jgi:hypothetical protein